MRTVRAVLPVPEHSLCERAGVQVGQVLARRRPGNALGRVSRNTPSGTLVLVRADLVVMGGDLAQGHELPVVVGAGVKHGEDALVTIAADVGIWVMAKAF